MNDQGRLLPGQRLRAEREARGISQEDAARRLNLTVTYLVALEADDYERLPEAAFVKGYIRNYARELDLPGDELAETFSSVIAEQAEEVPETVEVMPSSSRRRWWFVAAGVAVLVLIGVVAFWQQGDSDTPATADTDADAAAETGDGTPGEPAGTGTADTTDDVAPSASGTESEAGAEPAPAVEGPTERPAPDATAAEAAPDRLVMTFSGECWLRVTDAQDEVLFEGRRGSGVPLTLTGAAPFRIKAGDASAVGSVTVNDEDVAMPSTAPGQVVRMSVP